MPTVDRSALRTNQVCIIVLSLLAFALGDQIGPWLILVVGLVLAIGTAFPRAAAFKALYLRLLKPLGIVNPDVVQDDPAAHQFAQGVGAVFLLASFASLLAGAPLVGWILAWIVIVLAAANLVFGFCAGCFVYSQLGRAGLLTRRSQPR